MGYFGVKITMLQRFREALPSIERLICIASIVSAPVSSNAMVEEPGTFQKEGLQLRWNGPEQCPSVKQVWARIEKMSGVELESLKPSLHADAQIFFENQEWRLELETRRGEKRGQRTVRARSCEELAKAAALILSMSLQIGREGVSIGDKKDPLPPLASPPEKKQEQSKTTKKSAGAESNSKESSLSRTESQKEAKEPESPKEALSERTKEKSPKRRERQKRASDRFRRRIERRRKRSREAPDWDLVLFGGAFYRFLPTLRGGGGGVLAATWKGARLEVGGEFWQGGTQRLRAQPGGARLFLGYAVARGCIQVSRKSLVFPLCSGAEFGFLRGQAIDLKDGRTQRTPWFALNLGPQAIWWFRSWMGVRIALEALVLLQSSEFIAEGAEDVIYRPNRLGMRGSIGIEFRLP